MRFLNVFSGLAVVAGLGAAVFLMSYPGPGPHRTAVASPDFAYDFASGVEHTYRVVTTQQAGADAPPTTFQLTLALTGLGPAEGGWLVEAAVADVVVEMEGDVDTARLRQALTEPRAVLFVDDARGVVSSGLEGEASWLFESLVPPLVAELVPAWPATVCGEVPHIGVLGAGRGQHCVEAVSEGLLVRRDQVSLTRLHAMPGAHPDVVVPHRRAETLLSPTGVPESHHLEQRIEVAGVGTQPLELSATVHAERVGTRIVAVSRTARAMPASAPGVVDPEAAYRARLEARTAGLSSADVVLDLLNHGAEGKMPDHNRWLWRAIARLRLDPELAGELAELAVDPSAAAPLRALVADLLASTGDAPAQAALRQVADHAVRSDAADRARVIQALGAVSKPEEDLVDWLDEAAGAGGPGGRAAANTLAMLARRTASPDDVQRALDHLRDGLAAADHAEALETAITSLGNLGGVEVEAELMAFVDEEDPILRGKTARALRDVPTEDATEALWGLALDDDPYVQSQAVRSLLHRDALSDPDDRMAALAENGLSAAAAHRLLADLEGMAPSEVPVELLAQLAADAELPGHTRARAQNLARLANGEGMAP